MLSSPANLAHSINGRFGFMEKWIQRLQTDIAVINGAISDINAKNEEQTTDISAIRSYISAIDDMDINAIQSDIININDELSAINTKDNTQDTQIETINTTLSSLPETIFDIIYPIGSIYTMITTDPPPNIVTDETELKTVDFSPATINDDYWKGRLAKWELLESGKFLRNLGTGNVDLLGKTGGSTKVASHTHTVGGNTEYLYGAVVTSDSTSYGTFNSSSDNTILNATASSQSIGNSTIYPEKLVIEAKDEGTHSNKYTVISFDPTKIQINEVNPTVTEQVPPFQYVYIYKRVAKDTE